MQIKFTPRFKQRVAGLFEKYEFEVGILQNDEHREARSKDDGLGSYAGGPVRKLGKSGSKTLNEISADMRDQVGVNFYIEPFKKRDTNIMKFSAEFFKYAFGKTQDRRAVNLLQAIVRNPILRGEYGNNSRARQREKGFNRFMIDTAQLFKAIQARIVKVKK